MKKTGMCHCASSFCVRVFIRGGSLRASAKPRQVNAEKSIPNNQRIELRGYLIHEPESYGVRS